MSFRKDNKGTHEAWLARQCDVVKKDITYQHRRDEEESFIFLRAHLFSLGPRKSATGVRS